jgi:hypothetical protein
MKDMAPLLCHLPHESMPIFGFEIELVLVNLFYLFFCHLMQTMLHYLKALSDQQLKSVFNDPVVDWVQYNTNFLELGYFRGEGAYVSLCVLDRGAAVPSKIKKSREYFDLLSRLQITLYHKLAWLLAFILLFEFVQLTIAT